MVRYRFWEAPLRWLRDEIKETIYHYPDFIQGQRGVLYEDFVKGRPPAGCPRCGRSQYLALRMDGETLMECQMCGYVFVVVDPEPSAEEAP